jgi:hypothetical protein
VPAIITIDSLKPGETVSPYFAVRGTWDRSRPAHTTIVCTVTRPGLGQPIQPTALVEVPNTYTYWAFFAAVPANNQYQVETDISDGHQTISGTIVGNLTVANNYNPDMTINNPSTGDQVVAAGFQASGTYQTLVVAPAVPSGRFTLYDGNNVVRRQVSGPLAGNIWRVTFNAIPQGGNYQLLAELLNDDGTSVAADLATNLTAQ